MIIPGVFASGRNALRLYFGVILGLALAGSSCSHVDGDRQSSVLAIQPLTIGNPEGPGMLKDIVGEVYGLKVIVLPGLPIPEKFYNGEKGPRYNADSLLNFLLLIKPDTADYIAGITSRDLYTSRQESGNPINPNRGIFSLGKIGGHSCIISEFRLKNRDSKVQKERLKKVVLHEIGHNLRLEHCPDKTCLMADANGSVRTVDSAKAELCNVCRSKLKKS